MLRARAAGYAKKLSALLLCGAVCLLAACGGAVSASPTNTPIQAKATMAPTAPPSASPAVTPETTHALPGQTDGGAEPILAEREFTADELNGIAQADDVLPTLKYEDARKLNPDVVGWISIPGTSIDYPVVRCDDNEYYLGRNVEKQKSRYGTVFMDFRNADAEQQKHIILYGHNMKNGTMFHDLMNYKQKDFFKENRFIYFLWDGTETVWEIYLATIIPNTDGFTINYIATRFLDDNNFVSYMAEMAAYANTVSPSLVDESVAVTAADQVLTLSTCTYEYDNSRFAVQARRIK
ncbi:MAG TPA: class B sortase [Clostridia bacterium]|nr:MAG: Sortase family protein [Firmicutes bacterium ADurb.Bin248]HOG00439.1 class B sortase [Clostridia bacterium]HOS17828.1 class B sortase [Clostridia bacterium]